MKLIDGAALRDKGITPYEAYDHGDDEVVPVSEIDAAPTVCCAECGWWNAVRLDDWGGCENPRLCYAPRCFDTKLSSAFGCVCFERRTP
jgi:hypothetical protein